MQNRAKKYLCSVDEAVASALAGLAGRGVGLPCRAGCSWCCRLPVRATLPEGALALEYIKEDMDAARVASLVGRMRAYVPHGPGCPFLMDSLCVIYPVRPMGCRVHFSHSEESCRPRGVGASPFDGPTLVDEVLDAVRPVCLDYRRALEAGGSPFELRLLPKMVLEGLK